MQRRALIRWFLALGAAWPFRGVRLAARTADLSDTGRETLRVAAGSVLPSELGPDGAANSVERFTRWLEGYRSNADMGFGYGILRHRTTPAIDVARYESQLTAIEREAREQYGRALGELEAEPRQALLASHIRASRIDGLPARPDGRHVVVDLMAFYYQSSEANDLCYRARIGRARCRGLAGSSSRPVPLTER